VSDFTWEELWIIERMAQKRREHYLDMRNAHQITTNRISGESELTPDDFGSVYRATLEQLKEDLENRMNGQLRKRSKNVWQS
jgi:hypothetical protein